MLGEGIENENRQVMFDLREEKLHESAPQTNPSIAKAEVSDGAFLV